MAHMTPPSESEIAASEIKAKRNGGLGWRIAGFSALAAMAGYVGSGIREGLNLGNFFSEGAREANQTLKSGEELKIFGATAKLEGWTLHFNAEGSQKFLEENPGRDVRFRLLMESGGKEILVKSYPNDFEGIPMLFRGTARDVSNAAKSLGLQGLKDPESGHSGVLNQEFLFRPGYSADPVLIVEEEIQDSKNPDNPKVNRTIITLDIKHFEYSPEEALIITSERSLSQEEIENVKNFFSEFRSVIDKNGKDNVRRIGRIKVHSRDSVVFDDSILETLSIPSTIVKDQKALRDSIPEIIHQCLTSKVNIRIDQKESADALLKLHKFVNSKSFGME